MSLAQKKGCNLHVQVVRGEEVVISLGRQSYVFYFWVPIAIHASNEIHHSHQSLL